MPSELISQLVSEVSRYKDVNLGEREAEFLALIGQGHNSSYRIFSLLKKMNQPMDYKNVNKRVRRLQELGLIKEIRVKGESIHNAKFFALTSEGIIYLVTQRQWISGQLLIEYKNNLILRVLLYPYFEEHTVKQLVMLVEIGRYLRECCYIIQQAINFMQHQERLSHQGSHAYAKKDKILNQLEADLEWQAKALAFKLITKKSALLYEHFMVPRYVWVQAPPKGTIEGPSTLLKDKKFMALSKSIGKEYENAFSSFVKAA